MQPMSAPEVRWGEWIGEGWQMFVNQWSSWVLMILLMFLMMVIPIIPIYLFMFLLVAAADASGGDAGALPFFMFPVMGLAGLVILFGTSYLMSGAYRAAFKQLRGEQISVGDLFTGGDVFLRVAGALLLIGILASIGGIFCVLPAFLVAGLLYFTVPLIIERNMGVIEAMQASFERTKGNWLMFTLFALVVQLLAGLGQLACGVGILASYPLLFTITAVAFRDTFGMAGARQFLGEQIPPPQAYTPQSWSTPSAVPQPQMPPPPPPQPQMPQPGQEAMVCPRCGSRASSPTAKFCNVCGANLRG